MIYELAEDLAAAAAAMPSDVARREVVERIEEAIRRDIHFIGLHPTALLQGLTNLCGWYDRAGVEPYCEPSERAHVRTSGCVALCVDSWWEDPARVGRAHAWLRSLRPPGTGLGGQLIASMMGHEAQPVWVAFCPDGKQIASAAWDGTIRLWDIESGRERLCLWRTQPDGLRAFDFSPCGATIAGACEDNVVRIWSTGDGSEVQALGGAEGVANPIRFSQDGSRILGILRKHVLVWDVSSGERIYAFEGSYKHRTLADWHPDGHRIACLDGDKTIRIVDVVRGVEVKRLERTFPDTTAFRFSPDGKRIVTGARDGALALWDVPSGRWLRSFDGHEHSIHGIEWSPDSRHFVSSADDSTARVWNARSGRERHRFEAEEGRGCLAHYFPDGRRILTNDRIYDLRAWNVQNWKQLFQITEALDPINGDVISSDGTRIAGCTNRAVHVWRAQAATNSYALAGHTDEINAVRFDARGKTILTTAGDGRIGFWDAESGKPGEFIEVHETGPTWMTVSRDGRHILSSSCGAGDGHTIKVWDTTSHECVSSFNGRGLGGSWTISPRADRALHYLDLQELQLFDLTTGTMLNRIGYPERELHWRARFSPDGQHVCIGSDYDDCVQEWELETGELTRYLEDYRASFSGFEYSVDSRCLLSISEDANVHVWDMEEDIEVQRFAGHTEPVNDVCYSRDGTRVASVSADKTLRVWDANNGETVFVAPIPHSTALRVEYSRAGNRIVAETKEGRVFVCDAMTGALLSETEGEYAFEQVVAGRERVCVKRGTEAHVLEGESWKTIACYSADLSCLAAHPSKPVWAGGVAGYLSLMELVEP